MEAPKTQSDLLAKLEELGITARTVEHDEFVGKLSTGGRRTLVYPKVLRDTIRERFGGDPEAGAYDTQYEGEVLTVEQALPLIASMKGIFAKNLFLNDKKKNMWLYCAPHYVETKLNDLAKKVGAPGGFRFASDENLFEFLGLKQGSVSVFGLINDTEHKVKLILDRAFWEEGGGEAQKAEGAEASAQGEGDGGASQSDGEKCLLFHPLVNTATTGVSVQGLKNFLAFTGHKPVIL